MMKRTVKGLLLVALLACTASCGGATTAAGGNGEETTPTLDIASLNGTTDVATDSAFRYTFSEPMNTQTVTTSTYFIRPLSDAAKDLKSYDAAACDPASAITASVSCASPSECSLTPAAALTSGTSYIICLTTHIFTSDGTAFEGFSATFTTAGTTTTILAPASPTNVGITAGDTETTLSWDPVSGADSYAIFWKNAAGVTTSDTTIANATSPYHHTGLTNGQAYYYVVVAVNAGGISPLSSEVSATPQVASPGAPLNPSASWGYDSMTVNWNAVAGATSYNLYWSNAAGVTKATGTKVAGAIAPYVPTNLNDGATYYYVITAVNAGGEGPESAQVSATVHYPARKAFATSTFGKGDLGAWGADAGGKTGLAAGDAICNARAAAAGFPGTFKAWLSDENDDAYCRIHGGSGKKGACVGTTTAIGDAGPWVRVDGFPFAEKIDQMLEPHYKVIAPVRFDEFGTSLSGESYHSNTLPDGTRVSSAQVGVQPCGNWTSAAGANDYVGTTEATGSKWSNGWGASCSSDLHLLCLEVGPGAALPAFASSGKKVFISSVSGKGKLGDWPLAGGKTGIAAGDAICQSLATTAGLANAGKFKAWLSDTTTNAIDHIVNDGQWVRLDGVIVATSKADLTDGMINAPINLTEQWNAVSNSDYLAETYAWTGTTDAGLTSANQHCVDWTSDSNTQKGMQGEGFEALSYWTQQGWNFCDVPALENHLFCFED